MMAKSDVGVMRSINEDFYGVFEEEKLAIVCDGMGGHKAGEQASRLAVSTIRYMYLFLDLSLHQKISKDVSDKNLQIATRLISSVRLANRNVYKKSIQNQDLRGMGTTVSALTVQDDRVVIAHVGDSRVYRNRKGQLEQITDDHTWLNELIQDKEINPEDAINFERRNVITRALGQSPAIKIDVHIEPVVQGDLYLICTDGLTKAMPDEEILSIINYNHGLDHTLNHLIDNANMRDGSDNVTAALIKINENVKTVNSFLPVKLTIKQEPKALSRLEDKVLKREMQNQSEMLKSPKKISRAFSSRLVRYASLTIFLTLIMIFVVTKFKNKGQDDSVIGMNKSNYAIAKSKTLSDQSTESMSMIGQSQSDTAGQISIPDSVINQLVSTSIQSPNISVDSGLEKTKMTSNTRKNRGIIFLAGFEKSKKIEASSLFINYKYWGKTIDFRESGLQLPPGKYSITIRDSMNNLIFKRNAIEVSSGDVKTIELKNE